MAEKLTKAQRAWLEYLRDNGPAKSVKRGRTAFSCRVHGWSEWIVRDLETGEVMPLSVAHDHLTGGELFHTKYAYQGDLETITQAGRSLLNEQEPSP